MLRISLLAVLVSAVLGIIALLSGDFGETQGRVIATSLCIAGACLLVLPALALSEARSSGLILAPAVFAPVGFALLIFGIWSEQDWGDYWRVTATFIVVGVLVAYICLMALLELAERLMILRLIAYGLALLLALEVLGAVWSEDGPSDTGARVLGVTTILLTAATIALPLVRRMLPPRGAEGRSATVNFCPSCGSRVETAGESNCRRCGARFRVDFLA